MCAKAFVPASVISVGEGLLRGRVGRVGREGPAGPATLTREGDGGDSCLPLEEV